MVDLKDLMSQQPEVPAKVTESQAKEATQNINTAEAAEQTKVQADTAAQAVASETDESYNFMIEQGGHKVIIKPEQGLNYNFKATCTCHWVGRFAHKNEAEARATRHVQAANLKR